MRKIENNQTTLFCCVILAEGTVKKKPSKPAAHQPLVNMNTSQNASVPQQGQQTQQQILCLFTKDNAGQPTGNQVSNKTIVDSSMSLQTGCT